MEQCGHTIATQGRWSQCQVCGDSWLPQHKARVVARGWCRLESPWIQIPPSLHCPWHLPPVNRGIMFCGRVLHYSHRLVWHRGVVYCKHCGYYTQGLRVSYLAKRCRMKPVASQATVLKRMRAGKAPTAGGWPLPSQDQCPIGLKPFLDGD